MKRAERFYPYLWIQAAAIVLLFLYVFLTYGGNGWHFIWLVFALVAGAMGYLRQLSAAIGVGVTVVLLYGAYVLYRVYVQHELVAITWSDLTWLLIVLCCGVVGHLTRDDRISSSVAVQEELPLEGGVEASESAPIADTVQHNTAQPVHHPPILEPVRVYPTQQQLLEEVENAIRQALPDNDRLELLLIDFVDLARFEQVHGNDLGEQVVSMITDELQEAVRQATLLVRYGHHRLAVAWIVPPDQGDDAALKVVERAEQRLMRLLLDRPRSARLSPISLNCGGASFPRNGMTAGELLQHAERSLMK